MPFAFLAPVGAPAAPRLLDLVHLEKSEKKREGPRSLGSGVWLLGTSLSTRGGFGSSLTCTCQGGSLQGTGSAGDLQRTLETELGDKLCSF